MLVRDLGDAWQLVLQPDHGRLCGELARAWHEDPKLSNAANAALELAATRHDDGWAVWERDPRLNGEGRPQNFLGVPVHSLLSSYRACVDVVCAEDSAAGLFVSMHVSGLQRGRYGLMGGVRTPLEELDPAIRDFVTFEESRQESLMATLEFGEAERWRAYRRLQFLDTLSLFCGLADFEHGDSWTIGKPAQDGESRGDDPADPKWLTIATSEQTWTARCNPFPFATGPTRVEMTRRTVAKQPWSDDAAFRRAFAAAAPETVRITITAGP